MQISLIQFLAIRFFRTFQKYLTYAIAVHSYLLSTKFSYTVGNNHPQVPILDWNCQYLALKYQRKSAQLTLKTIWNLNANYRMEEAQN